MAERQTLLRELFSLESGGENETQIKQILREVSHTSINHYNYKKWIDQVFNNIKIILAQIENEYMLFLNERKKYKEMYNSDRVKSAMQNKIVPLDFFEVLANMHFHTRQILSWKFLEAELLDITLRKMVEAMGEVNAIDVEREVLKRIGEMQQKQNDLFVDIVTNKLQALDNKFISTLKVIEEEDRLNRKEIASLFSEIMVRIIKFQQEVLNKYNLEVENKIIDNKVIEKLNQFREKKSMKEKLVDNKEPIDLNLRRPSSKKVVEKDDIEIEDSDEADYSHDDFDEDEISRLKGMLEEGDEL